MGYMWFWSWCVSSWSVQFPYLLVLWKTEDHQTGYASFCCILLMLCCSRKKICSYLWISVCVHLFTTEESGLQSGHIPVSQVNGMKSRKPLSSFCFLEFIACCFLLKSFSVSSQSFFFYISCASLCYLDSVAQSPIDSAVDTDETVKPPLWYDENCWILHLHFPQQKPIWDILQSLNKVANSILPGK